MSWKPTASFHSISRLWRTLAFRLTAGYALAGLILVILATASLYLILVSELEKSTELFLGDKLHVLRTMLRERPADTDALEEEVELETAARRYEQFYIRLLDQQGKPLMTTPGMADELDLSKLARRTRGRFEVPIAMKGRHGQALRVATALAQAGVTDPHTVTIEIAIDVSQQEAFLSRFRLGFWIILLATVTIFPIVGYQIARQGIRPVEEMAATARRISSTHLGERIQTEGYPFELASLAGTFNQMLDRLEDSFDRISRFSGDIAHDLRTPVNNIRGEAEVALVRARTIDEYRDALESSLEEAVRLSDLIGNLLFLSRTENPLMSLRYETIDVMELMVGVQEYYEATAADGGINLSTLAGKEPVIAELDKTLMQRALGNLVSNSIAHTPPGGSVQVSATCKGGLVHIEVADTGIGIPPEALPRVFDRFFRVDPSRSQASGSTGLGLAIVQGIILLHRGKAEIFSEPGKGTRVVLSVPQAAPMTVNIEADIRDRAVSAKQIGSEVA